MKHLTLKRLEAPGNLEVRWGVGWGQSRGDMGVGRKYGIWNNRRVDRGGDGDKILSVKIFFKRVLKTP